MPGKTFIEHLAGVVEATLAKRKPEAEGFETEDSTIFKEEAKRAFKRDVERGHLPKRVRFKEWADELDEEKTACIMASAAWKTMTGIADPETLENLAGKILAEEPPKTGDPEINPIRALQRLTRKWRGGEKDGQERAEAPISKAFDCGGITLAIMPMETGNEKTWKQAFCQDRGGGWWPIDGVSVRPDGIPEVSADSFRGQKTPEREKAEPKQEQGQERGQEQGQEQGQEPAGPEDIKRLAASLRTNPPPKAASATPEAVNSTIGSTKSLQLNGGISEFRKAVKERSGVSPKEENGKTQAVALPENKEGRDLIIGGLNGNFNTLINLLKEQKFNPLIDRVFSTGNLTGGAEKGDQNFQCLALLAEPWFHCVKGRTELETEKALKEITRGAGTNKIPGEVALLLDRLENLPIIIKVGEGPGRFHIVHGALTPTEGPHSRILEDDEVDALCENEMNLDGPENLILKSDPSKPVEWIDLPRRKPPKTSRTYCGGPNPEGLHTGLGDGKTNLTMLEHTSGKGIRKPLPGSGSENPWNAVFILEKDKEDKKPPEKEEEPERKTPEEAAKDAMNPLPVSGKKKNEPDMGCPFPIMF